MERSYLTNDNTTCDVVDDFSVEDLLDFSNGDDDDGNLENFTFTANSDNSLRDIGKINTCNSFLFYNTTPKPHFSAGNKDFGSAISNFSDDLCIQCDDMAELEWLSNFVEEASFSTVDHLVSGTDMSATATSKHPIFNMKTSVPAKARSKRARTAARNWASQLLEASPTSQAMNPTSINISTKIGSGPKPKKRKGGGEAVVEANGVVRRCLHCNIDRTPQWRTGPMGPKTLCNACGVRYKSGRLVPEYRPAASPSFMLAKHSNSHRKVMELRRKKENNMQSNHHQQNILLPKFIEDGMIVQVQSPDEYLIHQRVGLDFRQLI